MNQNRNLANYEQEVMFAMCDLEELTFSDAQGIMMAQNFKYMQCLAKGLEPKEAAAAILEASIVK